MTDFDNKYAQILRAWIDLHVDCEIENTPRLLGYWTAIAKGQHYTEFRCSEQFREEFLEGYIEGLNDRKELDSVKPKTIPTIMTRDQVVDIFNLRS